MLMMFVGAAPRPQPGPLMAASLVRTLWPPVSSSVGSGVSVLDG
jgi:hypothetical protein